jgi:hypothetical protein
MKGRINVIDRSDNQPGCVFEVELPGRVSVGSGEMEALAPPAATSERQMEVPA